MTKKIRPMGKVLLDLELILDELLVNHDLQWGDVLSLVHGHMMVHNPKSRETYTAGGHPVFYYGPEKKER